MGTIRRWRDYARQYGLPGLLRYLAVRLVRPVWESDSADLLVSEGPGQGTAARADIRIGVASPGSLPPDEAPGWTDRVQAGHICYGAWLHDGMVHYSWVSFGRAHIGEVHADLLFGPEEAYVYDCFTDSSCRGMGVFPAVLSRIQADLFSQGVQRVWIAVEPQNRSSRRAILKAGFRPAGTIQYRRTGRRVHRAVHQEPGAPQLPIAPAG